MQSILIPHQDKQRRVRDGSEKSPRGRSLFPSVQRDRNSERSRASFLSSPLLPFPVEWKIQRILSLLSLHEKNNNNFPSRRFCPIARRGGENCAKTFVLDCLQLFFAITGQLFFFFFFLSPRHANWNEGREEIKKKKFEKRCETNE